MAYILPSALAGGVALSQGPDTSHYSSTESTTYEDAMLVAASAVTIPLAIGAIIISSVPPSAGIHVRDGVSYGSLSFESGVGFGTKRDLKLFSDARVMLGFTHVVSDKQKDFLRLEATNDFQLARVDRRGIIMLGVSPALGVFTNFPSQGYSAGASIWLMTPWLSYFGFIPQHTYGISYRYHRLFSGAHFHSLSLGMSAAFTFGWW